MPVPEWWVGSRLGTDRAATEAPSAAEEVGPLLTTRVKLADRERDRDRRSIWLFRVGGGRLWDDEFDLPRGWDCLAADDLEWLRVVVAVALLRAVDD